MAATPFPLTGFRVILAEDTWHTAMVIQQTLEAAGALVVGVAGNLEDAELLARDGQFNSVVMDLNMDGQRADDLAAQLAERGFRVVVVSGYRRPENFTAPVHAFLKKPTEPDKLIAALAEPPLQT